MIQVMNNKIWIMGRSKSSILPIFVIVYKWVWINTSPHLGIRRAMICQSDLDEWMKAHMHEK
jgi:hypothetical protein